VILNLIKCDGKDKRFPRLKPQVFSAKEKEEEGVKMVAGMFDH
jgi:hypothetical protein